MATRRNKRKREKSRDVEPVAKRTRLSTGAPMRRVVPVQYPQQWLLPRGKWGKDIAVIKEPHSALGKNASNHCSQVNKDLPSTSKAVSVGVPRRRSTCPHKKNRRTYIKEERSRRVARKRWRGRRRRWRGRRRRKTRKMLRRSFARLLGSQRSRRIIVRLPTQKKRRGPRKLRRIRMRKDNQRRPAFEQSCARGHENDAQLRKNGKETERKKGDLKDQAVEDPLNVRNICRNLVKHVQGRPADSRDCQPDNAKQGNERDNQQNPNQTSKKEAKKNKVKRRQTTKSKHVARKWRRHHTTRLRKTKSIGKRQRRPADRHVRRSAVYRSRQSGVKLGHRSAPIWRNYNKRSCKRKDVQRRQRANRNAEVARRRKYS